MLLNIYQFDSYSLKISPSQENKDAIFLHSAYNQYKIKCMCGM